MAQKQFTNYKDRVSSFALSEANLGIVRPGRLCGFDGFSHEINEADDVCKVTIYHKNGVVKGLNQDPVHLTAPIGVAITTQGVIIHQDLFVELDITKNTEVGNRVDLVYMEHKYEGNEYENPSLYNIIEGVIGEGVPSLPNDNVRVVLGYIISNEEDGVYHIKYIPSPSLNSFGSGDFLTQLIGSGLKIEDLLKLLANISPMEGLLGDFTFEDPNYIRDYQSVTRNLNNLDGSLKSVANSIKDILITDWVDISPHLLIPTTYITQSIKPVFLVRRNGGNIEALVSVKFTNVVRPDIITLVSQGDGIHEEMKGLGIDIAEGDHISGGYANVRLIINNPPAEFSSPSVMLNYGSTLKFTIYNARNVGANISQPYKGFISAPIENANREFEFEELVIGRPGD